MRSIESADAVLVLGEDVTNTAPRVALAVRQSAHGKTAGLAAEKHLPDWQADGARRPRPARKASGFIASLAATRLDDIAADTPARRAG